MSGYIYKVVAVEVKRTWENNFVCNAKVTTSREEDIWSIYLRLHKFRRK